MTSGKLSEAVLPEVVIASAGMDTSKGEDVFGPWFSPEHAGLLTARSHYGFASGFDNAGSNEEPLPTEGPVLHAVDILDEVEQFLLHRRRAGGCGTFLTGFIQEELDAVLEQALCPLAPPPRVIEMVLASE